MNWLSTYSNLFLLEPPRPRLMSLLGCHKAPRLGLVRVWWCLCELIHWEEESVPNCFIKSKFLYFLKTISRPQNSLIGIDWP
jgi:hypothetical protein